MRRTFSATAVAMLAAALIFGTPATVQAAEPVTPVTPIPELPSNTIRMTPTASGSWTATDWWKAVIWKAAQPGTEVATIPATGSKVAVVAKPITQAATLTRGAAGGPLVGAFMGGFAIGTFGLEVYGAVTGDDPLDNLCGTPFEGPGTLLYMGTMPDCSAMIPTPNTDVAAGVTPVVFGSTSIKFNGVVTISGGFEVACYTTTGSPPAISSTRQLAVRTASGTGGSTNYPGWLVVGPSFSSSSACTGVGLTGNTFMNSDSATWKSSNKIIHVVDRSSGTPVQLSTGGEVQTADPLRTPSCTITWMDGTSTTGAGTAYRETAGLPMTAPGMGCKSAWDAKPGAGREVMPDSIGIDSTTEGGAKTQIATQDVPSFSPEQQKALDPSLGNGRGLVLEKTVDGGLQSCNTWEADCSGWWTETSDGTVPGAYRCTFGGNPVGLTECGPYRHTFDTRSSTPTITDPVTGQPVPWSGTATNPGTVAGGVTGGGACGAAWSWNPVDWVLNPLKCAFIPSHASVAQAQSHLENRWQSTAVGSLSSALASWSFVAPASGCNGINVPISQLGHGIQDFQILNACPGEPLQPLASLSNVVIGISAVLTAIYAVTASIGGIVGARPVAAGGAS